MAAANVPVAMLDDMALERDVLSAAVDMLLIPPQGLHRSPRIVDVLSFVMMLLPPSGLLLNFNTVVVTDAVSNIIVKAALLKNYFFSFCFIAFVPVMFG